MDIAITVIIVAAAAGFLIRRSFRSTKSGPSSASSGLCSGECGGCTAAVELCKLDDAPPPTDINRR